MKKAILLLIPLIVAGCSLPNPRNERQELCDSINASWPVVAGDIELTKVSCPEGSYFIHLTLLNNGYSRLTSLERSHYSYNPYDENGMLLYTADDPYNKFIRELCEKSDTFKNTISLLCDKLWIESGCESNQGHIPLYVVIKGDGNANDSIELKYNIDW